MSVPAPSPRFSQPELDMLARTADAMSAYLGKPVLAEIDRGDDGTEWVTFGVPLDSGAEPGEDQARVQLGGAGARLLGQRGGLPADGDGDAYDCLYLWSIQITLEPGERFVKLDQDGEASAWSDELADVLPFALSEEPVDDNLDDEDDEEENDGDDDGGFEDLPGTPRTLH